MKRLLAFMVLCLIVASASAAIKRVTVKADTGPDVIVHTLNSRYTVTALDTFAAAGTCIYGPYNLVSTEGDVQPTTVHIWADSITGTTPTMGVDYQLISSFDINDTLASNWTAMDTIGAFTASTAITLSGTGKAIVFRVNNYDGTACQIPGMLRIGIKSATTQIKTR
jgi:hypothetical protein